jgi:hypothetical protein
LETGFFVVGRSMLYMGSGSATALHPLLNLMIQGSCTARNGGIRQSRILSEINYNMSLPCEKNPAFKKKPGYNRFHLPGCVNFRPGTIVPRLVKNPNPLKADC